MLVAQYRSRNPIGPRYTLSIPLDKSGTSPSDGRRYEARMGDRIRGRKGVELRKRRLANEPLCRMCKALGRTTSATVPDHIKPLALGGTDTDDNIRCLCADHHDQVTREEFGHRERGPTTEEWLADAPPTPQRRSWMGARS